MSGWRKEECREMRRTDLAWSGYSLERRAEERGRRMVWLNAHDVVLEAVPDHVDDEPTWPTHV